MLEPSRVVLCVEDEVSVRIFMTEVLADAGYHALEAVSPKEALLILQARPDVSVVVTDVEMGGSMNGFALARAVRERSANVQVIVTSGRSWPQAGDLPSGTVFLAKPLSAARMAEEVVKAVARAAATAGPPTIVDEDSDTCGDSVNLRG